jgi:hypothetical protein
MLSEGIYKELQHRPFSSVAKSKDVMKLYPITTLDENARWRNQPQDYTTQCFAEHL